MPTVQKYAMKGEGEGGWKKNRTGAIGENHDEKEGRLDVKFYTFGGGHYLFHSLS